MELDTGLIGWEDDEDPENPQNWTWSQKWVLMAWIAIMITISPTTSSLSAPGTGRTLDEFGVKSKTIGTLTTSIYVLGYAVGPLFLAPLSELYGRAPVINYSTLVFCAFLLGCALAPNMPGLIIMRLLAGIGGSAIVTIGSASIGDVFKVHERAAASAIVLGTQSLAPILGPLIGGFTSQNLGWRWAYHIILIVTVPIGVLMVIFMQESNHPTILEKKARRLRKELGRDDLRSKLEMNLPPRQVLARSLVRPIKFMFRSPIMFLVALYVAIVYGLFYLLVTTVPDVFQNIYHFEVQQTGLTYLGFGVGMLIGLGYVLRYNDRKVVYLQELNGGKFEPEMRLANTIYHAPFIPISLFIYAWTTRASVPWIIPCLSFVPFGFGISGILVMCQTYAVDAFLETSASAVAALVVMRSIFGGFLPLVGPAVYSALGLGVGNTVLGVLALVMTTVPFGFLKWGGKIRRKWMVKL
ncbi:MFS general substrate transporter [Ophiobolus disseminans]|uniref:MFS general substrate transporter n=1 Tax=Ophiobolus disseminans TaxID=1469910 RepID=A0A6A7A9X3_9PLEO|nr:MFS general substrate transporter [Ophiobolus disseminans]